MKYHSPEEIFPLMKDEYHKTMANKVYTHIMSLFDDIEIVSLRSCISIAKEGYIKFATISTENQNALLLHFPHELKIEICNSKDKYNVNFIPAGRYKDQINIPLKDISNIEDLTPLLKLAHDNHRKVRHRKSY
jgi:hypothetical protein